MPTDKQIAAFIISLVQSNVPRDIQEVLLKGNPRMNVAPSSLQKALTAAEQAQEAQPVAYRYRYTDPGTGKSVWRDKNGLWNGQLPSGSQALYTSPTIPEGWRLVPIEPTMEMALALESNYAECLPSSEVHNANWIDAYHAMLAAAPKPEDNK